MKALFHPRKKIRILFISIQGVFPKRKADIATKLGKIVSSELLSGEVIAEEIKSGDSLHTAYTAVGERVEERLRDRAMNGPIVIRALLNEKTITAVRSLVERELSKATPQWIDLIAHSEALNIRFSRVVETKILNFSELELESMLLELMKRELRLLEIWGAILGFLIGVAQLGLFYLAK